MQVSFDKMLIKLYFWCIILYSVINQTISELQECEPTIKMLDASGKIPSGILFGNIIDMGSFDECIKIKESNPSGKLVKGKYCLVKVKLPSDQFKSNTTQREFYDPEKDQSAMIVEDPSDPTPGLVLGWCIPDQCSINNITDIISPYLSIANASVSPVFGSGVCQTQDDLDKELTASDWGVISFFIIIGIIMILSTIYDVYLHYTKKESAHILLVAFSIKTNGEKLLTVNNNPQQLPCLHGIRFISMMWVLYGHRVENYFHKPIINLSIYDEWTHNIAHMYILNSTVSVDTFFILSGLLVCYGFLLAKDKGVKFNIPMYYLHRYIRLTPALGAVILIHIGLIMRFGSGPFWPSAIGELQNSCKENWWTTLLYIQNYYNSDKSCIGQTWYLAIDTQLFILSPLILIPLWRWPKYTMIGSGILVLGSIISSFVVAYHYNLPALVAQTVNPDYEKYYYFATHVRFGPWVMGLMLGYYIYQSKKKQSNQIILHPLLVCLSWIITLTLLLAVIFSPYNLQFEYTRLSASFFLGLNRHGWSLGVCMMIYLCIQGYGGPINSFLSWSVFQVLGRFTYTMYLTHLSLLIALGSAAKTSSYFSDFNIAYVYWGDFAFTLFFSICLTLSFESPMLTIEKVLFRSGSKTKTKLPLVLPDRQTEETFECQNLTLKRTE